jgi:hypothetical protein
VEDINEIWNKQTNKKGIHEAAGKIIGKNVK